MSIDHVGDTRYRSDAGMCVHTSEKYTDSVLNAAGLDDCNTSASPKVDKADMPGDSDDYPYGAVHRTVTCIPSFGIRRRPDCQSTIQWMCKRLQNPTDKAGRQIVKLETFVPVDGVFENLC